MLYTIVNRTDVITYGNRSVIDFNSMDLSQSTKEIKVSGRFDGLNTSDKRNEVPPSDDILLVLRSHFNNKL